MGANIPDEAPTLPASIAYIWELHKSMRFSIIPAEESYSLMPREPLTFSEVSSCLSLSSLELNRAEIDAILAIDSIFEKYRG